MNHNLNCKLNMYIVFSFQQVDLLLSVSIIIISTLIKNFKITKCFGHLTETIVSDNNYDKNSIDGMDSKYA